MNTLEIISALKKHNVVPRLTGDQLRLVGETGGLPGELIEQIKDRKEELSAFLRTAMDRSAFTPIPPIRQQENYPASNGQQSIWILSQLEGGSAAYLIVRSFHLKGKVIRENLEKAFQSAIQRHESLRTVFREINGELRQTILDLLPFEIEFLDISGFDDSKGYLRDEVERSAHWRFNLEKGPLIRVRLFQLAADEYAMIFGVHHIVSDGWSISILVSEIMQAYEACCKQVDLLQEPLSIQYKEYCQWRARIIEGNKGRQAQQFWKTEFLTLPAPLQLPTDFSRAGVRSFEGAVTRFYLGQESFAAILDFCRRNQVTPFNFFRAIISILLSKLSGQQDITIGTPVSGRNHLDLENQIGLYVNTLPLRLTIDPEEPFLGFLKQVSDHSFRAFEFQEYPFDKIMEDLHTNRDMSRNPLFDVMMVLQSGATGGGSVNKHQQYGFELGLLEKLLYPSGRDTQEKIAAKFDLNFNFDYEPDNTFYLEIEYDSKLFKKERIDRLFHSFQHIIGQVILRPENSISSIGIVDPEEKRKILTEFNSPVGEIHEYSIARLLESSFRERKEHTAILSGNTSLSYQELNDFSDSIAAQLTGINDGSGQPFVGLLMGRTEKVVISILGILKAGAAYVPIEITYPSARIDYIITDAQLRLLLVDRAGLQAVPAGFTGRVIGVDDLMAKHVSGVTVCNDLREQTAYLIYTSGSTGKPKGVEICHRNTIAFLKWACREFAATSFEILYATTSYCFDLSVFELLFPLLRGKTIRLLQSAAEIPAYIGLDKNIMINTVPSVVRSLLEQGLDWKNIAALNMAGEAVPENFKKELDYTATEIRNLYGPSEATTYSTVYQFAPDDHPGIPIGAPVDYTQLYIMDPFRNLQPIGVDGEIYLSGQAIAKGYFNRPDLTADRFLENPFLPGMIMYKTGDIGKWTEAGKVNFSGRIDDQVKIRGYRVEPGEIQARLEEHELVDQAVVLMQEVSGENRLVAYIKSQTKVTPALLGAYLSDLLPAYMIPAHWIMLGEIPLNSNGKVDKKNLPLPAMIAGRESQRVEPQTDIQRHLLILWKKVLCVEELGITDHFFERGGHSLKAMKLRFLIVSELGKEITLNELFSLPTIEKQARLLEGRPFLPVMQIPMAPIQDLYPISPAQEGLWIMTKFEDASVAYNMPAVFRVRGRLDADLLEAAFMQVIDRQEILRTLFIEIEGMPFFKIVAPENIGFAVEEVMAVELSREESLKALKTKWQTPFDLAAGPLLRCELIHTGEGQLLSFNMHHLISDGWSLHILYDQVSAAYRSLLDGGDISLPWPKLQYKDYAVWQRTQLAGDHMAAHRDFWRGIFKEEVTALDLPLDFNRPDVKTYNGATYSFLFPSSSCKKIRQLALLADASLFMTVMTAVSVLLGKYTGQQDMVIGTPVSARNNQQLQDQIGYYVNTLPIRIKIDPAVSFLSLLRQERELILEAFAHQPYSFEMLVEEMAIKRDPSRSLLIDVMVVMQDLEGLEEDKGFAPDVRLERLPVATGIAKYDLVFSFSIQPEGLQLAVDYNTGLFSETTVERMVRHLDRLLGLVTGSPESRIRDILLSDESELALLKSADRRQMAYDRSATVVSLFQEVASRHPDSIALVAGARQITYRELDARSSRLAKILIREYTVSPEDLVLLHCGRNEWMLIAILGVLKAGAAYVPVDPDYPPARIKYILEDSASRLVLSDALPHGGAKLTFADSTFVDITSLDYSGGMEVAAVQPSQLAYVIYTSGTTGNPKGVLIEHRHITRLLFHEGNLFDFGPDDRWSLFHSYCFDFSVWEMYGALLHGGTLVIVPKETAQNGHAFYDFLQKEKITVLNQTPTAFRSMLQANRGRLAPSTDLQARYLIFGGEALLPGILAPWHNALPSCRIINMYGITETTVHVTYKEITGEEIMLNKSNIGVPIPTVSCYVMDKDLRQVPIGVVGELCVGGAGVARGYLRKPDLTAEKFIDNPLSGGEKMYRSGDYARILPNGDIEYIGRKDDQVKIRGHRIELVEVEAAIASQPDIKDAVVLPLKNTAGEYDLAAYFVPAETFEDAHRLRVSLSEMLPAYMVPSFLIPLPAFPINSNGKLDKEALPLPEGPASTQGANVPSRHSTDRQLLAIWEEVLEKDGIGIRDNFFDLGGHSLKATRVVSKIHESFGIRIDLKTLFIDPTVEHLSNYIETVQWMENKHDLMTGDPEEIIF